MPKRKSMTVKLKSADRRRRRRSTGTNLRRVDAGVQFADDAPCSPNATDWVIAEILRYAQDAGDDARDATVLSAIKSILESTRPRTEEAARLAQRLLQIPALQNIPTKDFRKALQELLGASNDHSDPLRVDALLSYLELLSDA